jgi:transposase
MERLHIKDADIMRIAIQQEIERSEESRYDHRLHGVLMVSCGYSCTEVADLFGHSRRTVQYWVQRFEGRGFTGLQESERPGRPTTLNMTVRRNLEKDLRRSPRELRYSQNLWDGKLLSYHLTEKYGFDLGVRQCQRLFKQMGFRRRKPRPLIAHSDPAMQQAYKKTPSFGAKSKD